MTEEAHAVGFEGAPEIGNPGHFRHGRPPKNGQTPTQRCGNRAILACVERVKGGHRRCPHWIGRPCYQVMNLRSTPTSGAGAKTNYATPLVTNPRSTPASGAGAKTNYA